VLSKLADGVRQSTSCVTLSVHLVGDLAAAGQQQRNITCIGTVTWDSMDAALLF
jgi:hypothetical protein